MGGVQAVSTGIEQDLIRMGLRVERIAGANRAETAVLTAKQLDVFGNLDHIYLTDGTDWKPTLLAGPLAAKTNGVTLLTNGDRLAPETKAFLASKQLGSKSPLRVTAIGERAAQTKAASTAIVGYKTTDLSLAVAKTYFDGEHHIGVATNTDFADALIGGTYVASVGGPLVLINGKDGSDLNTYIKGNKTIHHVYVYGGKERILTTSDGTKK